MKMAKLPGTQRATQEPNPNISPLAVQGLLQHNPRLMTGGHGWVIPSPDDSKANCGGPSVCRECHLEFVACSTTDRIVIWEGWKLKPGDKLLLIAATNMPQWAIKQYGDLLKKMFPDVHVTIVQGFTGVQVHLQEPGESLASS
jgi:hypothetical protein